MRQLLAFTMILTLVGACAPTTSTGSLPVEVLVVVDSTDNTLRLIPVDSSSVVRQIPLGNALGFHPSLVAARGKFAIVAGNDSLTARAVIVNLEVGAIQDLIPLPDGTVTAVSIPDDGHAFVASRTTGTLTRINLTSGATSTLLAPGGPEGFGVTRGKVFAVIGNRQDGCVGIACPRGPSWLIQSEPGIPRDSVSLSGPGNAGPSALGPDGFLYVLNRGDEFGTGEGRLSIVDPIRSAEVASFGGVGPLVPSWILSDGGEQMLVASAPGGIMVFNTRLRRFTLPFGSGIPLEFPSDLVGDAAGRTYVLQRGGCSADRPGKIRVFGPDLIERASIAAGSCPVAGAMAEIAADRLFNTP